METDQRQAFAYDVLLDGHIRLLHVREEPSEDGLACELVDYGLDQDLEFFTPSYVWGSALRNHTIECDGRTLDVTKSVHEALMALKPKMLLPNLPIWIDAVCINQTNKQERSQQVTIMHRIYQQAKEVIIWLGPEEADSNLAMTVVDMLGERILSNPKVPPASQLDKYGLPPAQDPIWPALGRLFARPWFFRLWTMQEIVLATKVIVHCGTMVVTWRKIEATGYGIHTRKLWPLTLSEQTQNIQFRGFTSVANLAIMRKNREDPEQQRKFMTFSRVLPLALTEHCSEEKDRSFAVLAMSTQGFRDRIVVDYDFSLADLYIRCGKAALEEDPSLYYLQLVSARKRETIRTLPSWCVELEARDLEMLFGAHLKAGINESKTDERFPGPNVKTSPISNDIELHGFRADVVDRVIPMDFLWPHYTTVASVQNVVLWESQCRLLACETLGHAPDVTPLAHVCTLAADNRKREGDETKSMMQAYRDQMEHMESQAEGRGDRLPPADRIVAFESFRMEMVRVCPNRWYFSTINGRVGIGPPGVATGDLAVVLYGAGPVFVLRKREEPDMRQEVVGDAFVDGLMILDDTAVGEAEQSEWFVVC